MPGYCGDRFPELSADDREEYTCSICQDIFNTPVTTTCCRQTYCEDCINEWLKNNNTCPNDRKPLTLSDLSPPARLVINLLSKLIIRCDYRDNGCHEVVKLDELAKHTINCRYKVQKCVKCECEQTQGHDCIAALLAENRELKKKLAAELVVNKAAKYMDKVNLDASGSKQIVCVNGHQELKPGHDCIDELRALKSQNQLEIDGLRHALDAANLALLINTGASARANVIGVSGDRAYMTDHQILAECRRPVSAPELINNNMKPNMKDKTLSIIRDGLAKHHNLYHICKYVCDEMDLEYGTSWHCIAYESDAAQAYCTPNKRDLMRVKIGTLTLLLIHTNTVNVSNLKARIRHNKVERNIKVLQSRKMNQKMVAAVKTITFDAIDRKGTLANIAKEIADKMEAKYHSKDWQCVVFAEDCGDCYVKHDNSYIDYMVDQLIIYLCDSNIESDSFLVI